METPKEVIDYLRSNESVCRCVELKKQLEYALKILKQSGCDTCRFGEGPLYADACSRCLTTDYPGWEMKKEEDK